VIDGLGLPAFGRPRRGAGRTPHGRADFTTPPPWKTGTDLADRDALRAAECALMPRSPA